MRKTSQKCALLRHSALFAEGSEAGYFHNVGHEAVVLKTDLSPELVAASIATTSGLQGQVRHSGSYPNTYRWISYEVSSTEARRRDFGTYTRFSIEVRRLT